jgi:hypothetical protein
MKTTHKKRNIVFLTAVPAIALVLGFMWAGCSNPAGGGSPPKDTTARYSGESGGTKTELDITTKASGEMTYVLIVVINGETVESRGTVVKTGNTYTFKASTGESFTAALGDGGAPVFNAPLPIKDSAGNPITMPDLTLVPEGIDKPAEQSPFYRAGEFSGVSAYSGGALTFTTFGMNSVYPALSSAGLPDVALAAGGTVSWTPPDTLTPNAQFIDLDDFFKDPEITISSAGVKALFIESFTTSDGGKRLTLVHKTTRSILRYVYATAAVTVMGKNQSGSLFNLNLKQGWNLVMSNENDNGVHTGPFNKGDYEWFVENFEIWKKGAVTLLISTVGESYEGHVYYPFVLTNGGNTKEGSIGYWDELNPPTFYFTGMRNDNTVGYAYVKDADTLALLSHIQGNNFDSILPPAEAPHVFTLTGTNPNLGFDGTYTASGESNLKLVITGKVLTLYYSGTYSGGGIFTVTTANTTIKLNDLDITGNLSGSTLTLSGSDLSGLPTTWTK